MKTFNHQPGEYTSPDIEAHQLDVECGFATSTPTGKWADASYSSPDFAGLSSHYDGEFE